MSTALTRALQPVLPILTAPETEDLAIQQPGVGWWMKRGAWHRIAVPAMTYARLHGISVMAAAQARQVITSRNPILSTDILGDLRLQSMMPPTVPPGTMAVTLRRGDKALDDVMDVPRLFDISRWNQWARRRERQRARDGILLDLFKLPETCPASCKPWPIQGKPACLLARPGPAKRRPVQDDGRGDLGERAHHCG